MKPGDLVRLNDSMVTYYHSLHREDLAETAKDLSLLVIDVAMISADDPNCKLVTCFTHSGQDSYTSMFHSEDLVVLQTNAEKNNDTECKIL